MGVPTQFAAPSVRMLIIGLGAAGRIVHHDQPAAILLNGAGGSLLGTVFASLISGPSQAESFGHLDAVRAGREVTIVVKVGSARFGHADAVITLQPVSSSTGLAARAIVRIIPLGEGRFADPEIMRHALLEAPISQTGGGLASTRLPRSSPSPQCRIFARSQPARAPGPHRR